MEMIVDFHPQRSDAPLKLEKDGAVLIVNGERFDFSGLEQGATLPQSAIHHAHFVGPVSNSAIPGAIAPTQNEIANSKPAAMAICVKVAARRWVAAASNGS